LELRLKYPPYSPRLRQVSGKTQIFDFIRKKWLVLSPEEWVRQHLLNYLVNELKYPATVISVEKEIALNSIKKRYDVVVYKNNAPFLIAECKAPYIELDTTTVEQALRYNLVLAAPYVLLTNGIADAVFNTLGKAVQLPAYNSNQD